MGGTGTCTDDDHPSGGTTCATVNITLPRNARLLVTAMGDANAVKLDDGEGPGAGSDQVNTVRGQCFPRVDGNQVGSTRSFELRDAGERDVFSLSAISTDFGPGARTVTLQCIEQDGDIDWENTQILAVALSGD
jgi:hypothetical protein